MITAADAGAASPIITKWQAWRPATAVPVATQPFTASVRLVLTASLIIAVLAVYDLRGRTVSTRDLGLPGSGWHELTLTSDDELPLGVHFVQLTTLSGSRTQKAVLVR